LTSAEPLVAFAGLAVAVVVVVAVLLALVRRRTGARWATFGWGALAFVGSQVVRLPLLAAVGLVQDPVALVLTSGLAEETARWAVLRYGDRRARAWHDGVALGVGHGGTEAVLVVGGSAIGAIVLLAIGEGTVGAAGGEQAPVLAEQLDALRNQTYGAAALALWERVPAIVFHVSASLLVLRAVVERRWVWWAAAVMLHIAINGTVLALLPLIGPLGIEAVFTVIALGLLGLVLAARRWTYPGAGSGGATAA
jgi:uncharacterized membrane protein YhfC